MTSSDDLLNGIRENELASAMVELTRSIRSLRGDTAASQAAGVRFDAKLLTSIAKMADMAAGWQGGLGRIGNAETVVARCQQLVDDLTARVAAVTESSAGFDVRAKERVDIAYKALAKRIDGVATQLAEFPRGGYKGDPGSPGSPGKPGKAGPPGKGLPAGGSEGQIPIKASDNDYDIVWRSPDNAEGGARGAFTIWNAPASSSSSATNGLPAGGTAGQVLSKVDGADYNAQWVAVGGTGTVTTISVATANGVSGVVANPTTTPVITITLGAITPASVAASGTVTGSNLSGTNTGNQTITLTGDVTGSGTGSFAATIANDAVTYAKMQNVSATDKILGRSTAGSGDVEEIACTSFGRALIDDASVAAQVTTLGLDNTKIATITVVIDGGGSAITTGVKRDIVIPFACTINNVTMLADQSGSIVVDLWKDTYANYPPTVADTITASAPPTISGALKSQDTTLTGWNTAVAAGDIIRPNVNSCATITAVTLVLKVIKT